MPVVWLWLLLPPVLPVVVEDPDALKNFPSVILSHVPPNNVLGFVLFTEIYTAPTGYTLSKKSL